MATTRHRLKNTPQEWIDHYSLGDSTHTIGALFGVSPATVRSWLLKAGVQLRPLGPCPELPKDASEKQCRRCNVVKARIHFYSSKNTNDGMQSWCKECIRDYNREWARQHKEECHNRYHLWLIDNRGKAIAASRRWKRKNPNKCTEGSRRWVALNRKRVYHYHLLRRERKRGAVGSHTIDQWEALKKTYSYCCLRCGESEPTIVLTRDHVMPIAQGGGNSIDNIQPLCRPCNSQKNNSYIDYRIESVV